MLGETGTEQFEIVTRQDGKEIRRQKIHDPFTHTKIVLCISRWDLFKGMFRKQWKTELTVSVSGTPGVQRAIMTLDTTALDKETAAILDARRISRENPEHQHAYIVQC